METCPVELVSHCSGDYPMYIIAAKDSKQSASRGYPEELNLASMVEATESYKKAVSDFLDKYNIVYTGNISWILCSYWC